MPGTTGGIGYGLTLQYSPDGSSWTALAQVQDVEGIGGETDEVIVTSNDSPNAAHEKSPGLIKAENIKFKTVYKKTAFTAGYALWSTRAQRYWKVTSNDGLVWQSPDSKSFLRLWKLGLPMAGEQMIDGEVAVSGLPTAA